MLVCHCKRINDKEIRRLVHQGARTVGHVATICGAGTCCGGCVPAIAEVVRETRPLPITTFNMRQVATGGERASAASHEDASFIAAE